MADRCEHFTTTKACSCLASGLPNGRGSWETNGVTYGVMYAACNEIALSSVFRVICKSIHACKGVYGVFNAKHRCIAPLARKCGRTPVCTHDRVGNANPSLSVFAVGLYQYSAQTRGEGPIHEDYWVQQLHRSGTCLLQSPVLGVFKYWPDIDTLALLPRYA